MSVNPAEVRRRLAYIQYMHHLGVEQARLPEPQSSASILMLHDASEAFLLLAAEHLEAAPPRDFEKYWEALSPRKLDGGVVLPGKQGMTRLNRIRVTLKHHGGHPDQPTIDQARLDTGTFLEAGTSAVFGLDYATVSMADVISQQPVRELVHKAEALGASGDQRAAMIALAEAFEELFDYPRSSHHANGTRSPFRMGPSIRSTVTERHIQEVLRPPEHDRRQISGHHRDLARQIADVTEITKELQTAARFTALGIDFGAYQRFHLLTPRIYAFMDGRREYRAPEGYAPSADDLGFCSQFIVTAALRLAAAEAQLAQPAWTSSDAGTQHTTWETIAEMCP